MPKPRAVSEQIVVPSIGSREIARAQRSVSGAAKMRSKAQDLGNSSTRRPVASIASGLCRADSKAQPFSFQ
jgi:hypothetical protein